MSRLNHLSRSLETEFDAQIYRLMSKSKFDNNNFDAYRQQGEMVHSGVLMPDKQACRGKRYVDVKPRIRTC